MYWMVSANSGVILTEFEYLLAEYVSCKVYDNQYFDVTFQRYISTK